MYNRRYDKKFLMLRQEHTGYSFGNKTPWGSCMIEIKNNVGFLQVKVQGLQKTKYDVYCIGKTGLQTKSIFCQSLSIDKQGQGELLWEFSPDSIQNLPISIEEIHTIAILIANEPSIIAPLVAYTKDTIKWRTHFQLQEKIPPKKSKQTKQIPVISAPTTKEPQPKISDIHIPTLSETRIPNEPKTTEIMHQLQKDLSQFERTEESILSASESIFATPEVAFDTSIFQQSYEDSNAQNYHGNFKNLIQKFHNELDILKKEGIFEESDLQKIKEAGEQSTKHFKKSTDEFLKELNHAIPTNTAPKFEKIVHILEPKKNIPLSKETLKKEDSKKETPPKDSPKQKETSNKKTSQKDASQKEISQSTSPNNPQTTSLLSPYFSQHTKVTPFSADEIWTCITLEEIVLLPMFPLSWQTELFFIYPMKSYQHLLYREENGVHLLAVPCRKDEKELESSDASFFGFHSFQEMNQSDFGYWIRKT